MINDTASPAKTLLPSRELYWKAVRRDLFISVPILLIITGSQSLLQLARARIADDGTGYGLIWLYVSLTVLALALSFAVYQGVLRNSRIDLGATAVTVTNWLGRKRTIEHANVGTVIQTMLRQPAVTLPALFLLDRDGKRVVSMYGTLWPTDAMLTVGAATPVQPTVFQAPVSFAELRAQYPKGVSWARAHPILLTAIIAGSLLLALIMFIIVLFATLFGPI
jgi:hypothetical protein